MRQSIFWIFTKIRILFLHFVVMGRKSFHQISNELKHFIIFSGTMISPQKNLGNQTVFKRDYYVGKIAMAIKEGENAEQYSKLFSQPINAVFRTNLKKEKKVIAYYLLCELVKSYLMKFC